MKLVATLFAVLFAACAAAPDVSKIATAAKCEHARTEASNLVTLVRAAAPAADVRAFVDGLDQARRVCAVLVAKEALADNADELAALVEALK